jgi:hypothetical protein
MLPYINRRFFLQAFLISFTLVLSLATLQAGVIAQINFGYYSVNGGWTVADPYLSTTNPGETVHTYGWGGDFPPNMDVANGARAMAEGLALHVYASAGIHNGNLGDDYPSYTYAEAIATATDRLLIASSSPGLDGNSGTAVFGIGITGAIYLSGQNPEGELWLNNQLIASADNTYDQMVYVPFNFVFGQQFAFGTTLKARAAVGADVVSGYYVNSNVSFFDTATIEGMWIYDQYGHSVMDYTITSQEGVTYPGQGQVPEPGVWALSGAGLLALCIRRMRR